MWWLVVEVLLVVIEISSIGAPSGLENVVLSGSSAPSGLEVVVVVVAVVLVSGSGAW